jgi:hypothetical protein
MAYRMKKLILLTMVCTGFIVTTPFIAQAVESEKIGQNLDRETNVLLVQYGRNPNRDNQDRRYQNREQPFVVYYRSRDDRKWIYSSIHYNRREARRAARRLERRGYRTQILG